MNKQHVQIQLEVSHVLVILVIQELELIVKVPIFFFLLFFRKKKHTKWIDNDECTLNTDNCDEQATCTNAIGSFSCACNTGYSGNGVSCEGIFLFFLDFFLQIVT